jgi:putative phosphoribosyl transferase
MRRSGRWGGEVGRYADRAHAGRVLAACLAEELSSLAVHGSPSNRPIVVLGLPRGGVPVAAPIAERLSGPLDVLVVRKLGLPGRPELAMGAIASVAGTVEEVRNLDVMAQSSVTEAEFAAVLEEETAELRRREHAYRGRRPVPRVRDAQVVVVDDGLATGATMRAAVAVLRRQEPAQIVVAVPVGSASTCRSISADVDHLVCAWIPRSFEAVGQAYADFSPTTDDEVRDLLRATTTGSSHSRAP